MDNNNFNQQGFNQQFQNIEPTQPVYPQQQTQTGTNQQFTQPAQTGMNQQFTQPAQQNMGQQFAQPAQTEMKQQFAQSFQQNMGQQFAQPAQQNMGQQFAQPAQSGMNQQFGGQQFAQSAQQNMNRQFGGQQQNMMPNDVTQMQSFNNQNGYNNYNAGGNNGGNGGGKKTGLVIGIIIAAIVLIAGIATAVILLNKKNKEDKKDSDSGKQTITTEMTTTEMTTTEATTTEATTTEATTTEATTTEATTTEAATTESGNNDQIPEGSKYYILTDFAEDGQDNSTYAEQIKYLEGYKYAYLIFYPDGKGYIYVYSTFDDEFTYDDTSVTITGERINMTSQGNEIYLKDGTYTLTLKEVTKEEFDSLQEIPEDL